MYGAWVVIIAISRIVMWFFSRRKRVIGETYETNYFYDICHVGAVAFERSCMRHG